MGSTATSFSKGKTHPINPNFASQDTMRHDVYQPKNSQHQNDTANTVDMWSTVISPFQYEMIQLPDAFKKIYGCSAFIRYL